MNVLVLAPIRIKTKALSRTTLWKCHIDLSKRERKRAKNVTTKWDLILPVPSKYNVNGGGVLNQLNLDAGLLSLTEGDAAVAKELGPCWSVVSKRLARYEPVHPMLAERSLRGGLLKSSSFVVRSVLLIFASSALEGEFRKSG